MVCKWLNLFVGAVFFFVVVGNVLVDEGKIMVFVVVLLINVMQDIVMQFKKEKGVDVVFFFVLLFIFVCQIEVGAFVDLFIFVDQKWMDYVVDKKVIDIVMCQILFGNSLVVVVLKVSVQKDFIIDSKINWILLLNGGCLVVGDLEYVFVGIYVKEVL